MFVFSPVGHALRILRWLAFFLLQVFLTCKDNLIRIFCVTLWPLSTNVSHTPIRCMCPFGQKRGFPPLIPNIQTIIQVGLLTILLYPMCAPSGLRY